MSRAKTKIKDIRQDLMEHLEDIGVYGKYYEDLVDDYCKLWEIKEMLWADISARGVAVEWYNSETSKGVKKNDSVVEFQKTNAQMMKILDQLGITTKDIGRAGSESDAEDFFED